MTRFLRRLVVTAAVFVAYLGIGTVLNHALFRTDRYEVPADTKVLIAGDSHPRRALNPAVIDESVNVSQDAEPYFITYYKLKDILESNPGIEAVVLGFAHHNLSSFNDQKLRAQPWASEMFRRYYPVVPWQEIDRVDVDAVTRVLAAIRYNMLPNKRYLMNIAERLRTGGRGSHPYVGAFAHGKGNTLREARPHRNLTRHYWVGPALAEPSAVSLTYLERIVRLTEDRDVILLLATTPLHEEYAKRIPGSIRSVFEATKTRYEAQGIVIVDASDYALPADHFHDSDHVNAAGAAVVSAIFDRRLREAMDD